MDSEAGPDGSKFLAGGGEMGALMRAHDWRATPVGWPRSWPQSLKTAVRLMLNTRHPMFIWWGEALTCFYNDAYRALIGPDRHPGALGRPGREVWAEIWDIIGPQIELVMAGRGATWHERHLVPITRGDRREDVWWTYGYSPIDDEGSPNGVGGVLVVCRDVTAEVRAEQMYAGEAERLRQLFEQAPGFMAVLRGPEHVFELANAAYVRLVGRDVLGRPVREVFPEIESQGFFGLLDTVYDTGEAFTARRAPITFASGPGQTLDRRFLDFVYQPIRDPTGTVTGIFVEGSDITDAELVADALRASEARQRLLLGLMRGQRQTDDPEAIMRAAAEAVGRHLGANRAGFCEMLDDETLHFAAGWADGTLDLLRGTIPAAAIGTGCLAEARKGAVLGIADVARDPLTADSRLLEIGVRAIIYAPMFRNGRWRAGMHVHHAAVRDWTAEEISLVRDAADQTWDAVERARAVQAERELNLELEQRVRERTRERDMVWRTSNDLLVICGEDGLYRAVNPAWTTALGYTAAELVGMRFDDLAHPDDVAASRREYARLMDGNMIRDFDMRVRAKDGSYRWYSWHGIPEDKQFYAAGRDVTERKQLEEQLRQSQKMEAVGQLTGGIAHDFNNLLQGVLGALELARLRIEDGRIAELPHLIDMSAQGAQRAATLTQRLLAFARRQPLDPRPVDVNRLVVSIQELLGRTLGPAIELRTVLVQGLWQAFCDANQLENIILNLAINARDAMQEGGRLTVETANADLDLAGAVAEGGEIAPGQYVTIAVTDTGTGMAPEVAARVFEPFYTTKPIGQGTGLGLSMLYGFVKQSGGHVLVSSELGRGTTMRLYLPRHLGEPGTESGDATPPLGDAAQPAAGATVLVVDDEAPIRALVADVLADIGCRVLEAEDASAGLRTLQSDTQVDLLVTDVGLPGSLDGRQFADAARRRRPELPVLFITGYSFGAVAGDGAGLGPGMEMIAKPFALDALAARVRRIIERQPSLGR